VHSPEAPAAEEDDTTRKPRERRRRSLPARRPTTASTTRVFVANLPFSTTDEEMAALFEDFSIESANVARLRK
jgi:RNA recognition motif-containing protein